MQLKNVKIRSVIDKMDFLEIQNRIFLTILIEFCFFLIYTGIQSNISLEKTHNFRLINFYNLLGTFFLFLLINLLFFLKSHPIKQNISKFIFLIILELAHYLYFGVYIPWDQKIEEEILKIASIYLIGKKFFLPILFGCLFLNLKNTKK